MEESPFPYCDVLHRLDYGRVVYIILALFCGKMSVLFVCSEKDLPSVNMKNCLMTKREWEDVGTFGNDRFLTCGDAAMMITSDLHIYSDNVDVRAKEAGISPDTVIFMSRHSAASGEAALTVHPIGNYGENKYGGKEGKLVRSAPSLMSDALRKIMSYSDLPEFKICFEVTHHGPWLERPTFFIEIGSDEKNWGNIRAADILSDVLLNIEPNDYISAIGVAGGHYAPRFTEVVEGFKVNFGHMIPNYHLEGKDDESIIRMTKDACEATGTDIVYIHKKSLKKPEERHISELISSAGFELISSSDLDPINENQ
jgi:Uncharacterized protein conserved in archaea